MRRHLSTRIKKCCNRAQSIAELIIAGLNISTIAVHHYRVMNVHDKRV